MKKWSMLLALAVVDALQAEPVQKEISTAPRQKKSDVSNKKRHKQKHQSSSKNAKVAVNAPSVKKIQEKIEGADVVNKIAVIIYVTAPSQPGSDKELEKVSDIVITLLDVERPSIDGRLRTLDELILDKLLFFEATYYYRMVISDDAIDKYINSIKEHYGMSDEQLRGMFKQAGYTYEEGRQQLAESQAIEGILNFKIKSRLVVPEATIRAYYDEHPVYEEASYKIKKAFIPEGLLTQEELAALHDTLMEKSGIEWSVAYWLSEDEITDERKALLQSLAVGDYTQPEQVTGGYEVIKLLVTKPRTRRSFEDSYREIQAKLQEPQYYKMLEEFKKEIFSKYEIVYL